MKTKMSLKELLKTETKAVKEYSMTQLDNLGYKLITLKASKMVPITWLIRETLNMHTNKEELMQTGKSTGRLL